MGGFGSGWNVALSRGTASSYRRVKSRAGGGIPNWYQRMRTQADVANDEMMHYRPELEERGYLTIQVSGYIVILLL